MDSVEQLEKNLLQLLAQYSELKNQFAMLQEENHKQRLELLQAHADLHQLKHDYNQLHTAHTILLGDDATDEDRVKAKQRITNIILQVDKAIEALTQ
jgi:regulator of replication initiation timing